MGADANAYTHEREDGGEWDFYAVRSAVDRDDTARTTGTTSARSTRSARAGAPTGHRPPSPDPAIDRVLERYGVW